MMGVVLASSKVTKAVKRISYWHDYHRAQHIDGHHQ